MTSTAVVKAERLSKTYRLYGSRIDIIKEFIHPLRKIYHRDHYALRDVSFEIKQGETLGVIGKNGSGKSTLLKILTGVLTPSGGALSVNGKISALLELGAGFNPELTGIENIYFNGTIMGYSRSEINSKLDDILSFADIGEYVYQPVKMYSSGMFVRLAFAVATSVIPDVLIVDEALSVGDIFFVQKCHERMTSLMNGGTTVILVSHDMQAIEKYCKRVLLLDKGETAFLGAPNEAILRYHALNYSTGTYSFSNFVKSPASDLENSASFGSIADWPEEGSGAFLDMSHAVPIGEQDVVICKQLAICDTNGRPCTSFAIGSTAVFYSEYELHKDIDTPIGGIALINKYNAIVHAKNSLYYAVPAPSRVSAGSRIRFRQEIKLDIAPEEYTFVGLFGAIPSEYYSIASELDHTELTSRLQGLLRVKNSGRLTIFARRILPFYGYADLPGNCAMSVI